MCEKAGIVSKLGPKILMPGEVKQADYGNWLECVTCRRLCPIYNAKNGDIGRICRVNRQSVR
jgi:hypothetical protein